MATPLIWKAFQIQKALSSIIPWKHPVSMDLSRERYQIESRTKSLIPFYVSVAFLVPQLFFCIYIIFKYFHAKPNNLPISKLLIYVAGVCMVTVILGFYSVIIMYRSELFEGCSNHIFEFDRKIRRDRRPKGYFLKLKLIPLLIRGKQYYSMYDHIN